MKRSALFLLAAFSASLSAAAIRTESVTYKHGKTSLEGYLAYDDAVKGPRPGVIVVHEWYGLNDFAKKKAEEVAALGYVALAADIYGKGVRPTTQEEAGKQSSKYKADRELMRGRAGAALKALTGDSRVDGRKIAAIGFCFGGTVALELARAGAELAGAVSFHGGLATPEPEDARNIKAKVLVLHGADDPHSPKAEVDAFIEEMNKGNVDWELDLYSGAVHAFTNPNAGTDPAKGVAYNKQAAERSWQRMTAFFDEIFATSQR